MKKFIKKIYKLTVLALLLFCITINANALTKETQFIDINDNASLDVGSLQISNISFRNIFAHEAQAFGIFAKIYNSNADGITYTVTTNYYDSNYNFVIQSSNNTRYAYSGNNVLNLTLNVNKLENYTINDIKYFRVSIETDESSSTTETNNAILPSKMRDYKDREYVIDKYDINVIVNENNTLDITEKITAYFNVEKHCIFRTIPLKNTITRLDGTTSKNRVKITNLYVDHEYKTTRENGNYKIKIGSPYYTLTGEQTYLIQYSYNLGKDPMKEYDELYYNLIGTDWDTVIGNVTFSITMPKDFDSSKLGFSSGRYGSTENNNVKYSVDNNIITGSYAGILSSGEALTVRCELPEGYFINTNTQSNYLNYILISMPIIFLIISLILWRKYGKDNPVIETVEFYPPEGFNSLEVGFMYKGKADSNDVTSLLVYLANKGYIKISEIDDVLIPNCKDFQITKLKEYDGNDVNEQAFLDGLFAENDNASVDLKRVQEIRNEAKNNNQKVSFLEACKQAAEESKTSRANENTSVTSYNLYNQFYKTMNKILSNVNNKNNRYKIFEKSSLNKRIIIILMIIATYCIITIQPLLSYGEPEMIMPVIILTTMGFIVMFNMLTNKNKQIYVNGVARTSNLLTKILSLIIGILFGSVPWVIFIFPDLMQETSYIIEYIIGMISIFGMILCYNYLPKRTLFGNEMLGKLKGFRNFLATAEKDKLEAMVLQNPSYFYNILPYTYVLGVSDKWIKNFESISMKAPNWYDSPNAFDISTFGSFMNNTMTSAQSAMTSSPSSSSGGGGGSSSGGGSSGGGSGGGGGGSW